MIKSFFILVFTIFCYAAIVGLSKADDGSVTIVGYGGPGSIHENVSISIEEFYPNSEKKIFSTCQESLNFLKNIDGPAIGIFDIDDNTLSVSSNGEKGCSSLNDQTSIKFAGIFGESYLKIYGVKDKVTLDNLLNDSVTIGTYEGYVYYTRVKELAKRLNKNITVVPYGNGKLVYAGVISGEIDFGVASRVPTDMSVVVTADRNATNIPSINTLIDSPFDSIRSASYGLFIVVKNMNPEMVLKSLREMAMRGVKYKELFAKFGYTNGPTFTSLKAQELRLKIMAKDFSQYQK